MDQKAKTQAKEEESSIAWFKLADLVSRGEKEKALTLFRLLSHSFEDRGYVLQLEGDILWAFEDGLAIDRYKQAAFLYKKERKFVSAAAVYEHLLVLQPQGYEIVLNLLELYVQLNVLEKVRDRFTVLFALFENKTISVDQIWMAVELVFASLREHSVSKKSDEKQIFSMVAGLLEERMPELELKAKMLYKEQRRYFVGL